MLLHAEVFCCGSLRTRVRDRVLRDTVDGRTSFCMMAVEGERRERPRKKNERQRLMSKGNLGKRGLA